MSLSFTSGETDLPGVWAVQPEPSSIPTSGCESCLEERFRVSRIYVWVKDVEFGRSQKTALVLA